MNSLTIIGNVTKDVELRTTQSGKSVCTFTVAVNRRKKTEGQPDADFFRVSAWEALGENCAKYLTKGKKICVIGSVTLHQYTAQDGKAKANLEVMAREVEFLSPKDSYTEVNEPDNPFTQPKPTVDDIPY